MKNSILRTSCLCKTFISESLQYNVLKNIDLEIYEGDFTVIMGSSGSGKSTLLYLLSGLDHATSGEIYFREKRIDKMKEKATALFRRKNIGFVFQSINLVPNLTLYENITIPGYLSNKNRKEVNEKAMELLKTMELDAHAFKYPSQVSGGQQQRTAIARGVINKPEILFADEPTGSLNSAQGEAALDMLTNLNNSGQTIIMVTHDLKAACRANRLLFLKDGSISGEMHLDPFSNKGDSLRESKIFEFLKEKGW